MKKIICSLVAFMAIVAFSFGQQASAQTFKDVSPSASYYSAVEFLAELGAISKTTGKFNPSGTVTRGQAAKILTVTLDLDEKNVVDPKFKDVPKSSGYYPYVAALQNAGIINGKAPDRFGVNDPLTRGQMAKILVKGFGLPEFELEGIFEDEPAVALGKETRKYVSPLYFYGITTGESEGRYGSSNRLTRSQLARFIERTYNIYDDIKNDQYITSIRDDYEYPESTQFDVADILTVGYDGGFLLHPYKAGQTAVYYGNKTLLVTVDRALNMQFEEVTSVPENLKLTVADYRYYDFEVISALSFDVNGKQLEDLTPTDDLTSLSFMSRDTKNFTRLEVILENGDLYEYFIRAELDATERYYVTKLYEINSSISFYYLYDFEGNLKVTVPENSGLTYKVDNEYITFKATKPGKFEVAFGMDVRGIEVIEVNGDLAVREFELE